MSVALNKVIEEFDSLATEEKEVFQGLVNKAMVDEARKKFKSVREEAIVKYEAGELKGYKNADEVMSYLLDENT